MSRWLIEKNGTGIEKSGSGIEKSGSGIEKSGSGIEKSGSGIQKSFLVISLVALSFASQVSAYGNVEPAGNMQIVVDDQKVAVSWIIGGSVFSGVSSLSGSFVNLALTEVGLTNNNDHALLVAGGGTGKEVVGGTGVEVAGGGTGSDVAGGGTGSDVAGGGTGSDVAGGGTGSDVAGGGTGSDVAGGGTGSDVAGGGTGSDSYGNNGNNTILVAGGGTGSDAIVITLPGGTDMQMEVSLGCNSASVSILDSNFVEVVSFANVPVFGASGFCSEADQGFGNFYD